MTAHSIFWEDWQNFKKDFFRSCCTHSKKRKILISCLLDSLPTTFILLHRSSIVFWCHLIEDIFRTEVLVWVSSPMCRGNGISQLWHKFVRKNCHFTAKKRRSPALSPIWTYWTLVNIWFLVRDNQLKWGPFLIRKMATHNVLQHHKSLFLLPIIFYHILFWAADLAQVLALCQQCCSWLAWNRIPELLQVPWLQSANLVGIQMQGHVGISFTREVRSVQRWHKGSSLHWHLHTTIVYSRQDE